MLKICIVSPSLNLGGIERALTTIANYMDEKGYEVLFISCLRSDQPFFKLNETIQVVSPNFKRSGSIMNKITFYARLLLYIRKSISDFNPDRVLVYGDWFNPMVLLALIFKPYPVYISDRTSPTYKFSFPIPILKKILYPTAAGFIAQTTQAENHKKKMFGNKLKTKVIPNMVHPANGLKETKTENSILYAGRFAWEKAPERLIRAFALSSGLHNFNLIMAGSGPLLEESKALCKSLGLTDRVQFLGNVKNMKELYVNASIFVLPSVIEGFPNALAEAMSFGLPCIIFDDISHEDFIIDGESGFVIKNGDLNDLANKIAKLTGSKELRFAFGQKSKQKSLEWSVEKVGVQLESFIFQ